MLTKPTNTPEPTSGNDDLITEILAFRQHAIGFTVSSERLLEALGYPVQTAIVTRQERRHLTRTTRKRNI